MAVKSQPTSDQLAMHNAGFLIQGQQYAASSNFDVADERKKVRLSEERFTYLCLSCRCLSVCPALVGREAWGSKNSYYSFESLLTT